MLAFCLLYGLFYECFVLALKLADPQGAGKDGKLADPQGAG